MAVTETDVLYGYERVSTKAQDVLGQHDKLIAAGVPQNRIFTDEGVSGKLASRPQWDKLLEAMLAVREALPADVKVVLYAVKLDRIGRSVKNLVEVVNWLGERGIDLVIIDQNIDTTTPMGKFVFHIMAALAEFERDLIISRTRDGLEAKRARGIVGGRKPKLSDDQREHIEQLAQPDAVNPATGRRWQVTEIAEKFGVSRNTILRILNPDYRQRENLARRTEG